MVDFGLNGYEDENPFELTDNFLEKYKSKEPPFGFGGLGKLVYMRTYSRIKDNGKNEQWWETIRRVVEGTYNLQKQWVERHYLGWNPWKAQNSAQEMYDRIFHMKFTPPGRGLWAMGTPITEERGLYMSLNNCAFVSTATLDKDLSKPFCFLMDVSMLGVGCGFDVKGADMVHIYKPKEQTEKYVIPDTREGWVESVRLLIDSYLMKNQPTYVFDYSQIREKGEPIKTFGGKSSGYKPLEDLHNNIRDILDNRQYEKLTSRNIVDIMNMIGKCVVAGNVRRTAEIAFGDIDDEEYLNLKNYDINPERSEYGWTSNNSIFAELGMDYTKAAERTIDNGEPGYAWLENMKNYGRMEDKPNYKDHRVQGGNPCQPGFANILTPDGIRVFDDISIGDQIWSESGWTIVKNKWSNGVKPVYKYKTTAGVFIGTEDHKISCHGKKIEVDNAEGIDVLQGLPNYSFTKDNLNSQIVMDGLVMGDGTLKTQKSRPDTYKLLCIGEKDQDYFEDPIHEYISHNFDGIDYRIFTNIQEQELVRTYERDIPERYVQGSPKEVASFLRGLFSANGDVLKNYNRIGLRSTSFKVIEKVQIMLNSLGIRSYYTTDKKKKVQFSNGEYECKESYKLNISTDRKIFNKYIGFIQKYKQESLDVICNNSINDYRKTHIVTEKEYLGDYEVFDITVDNEYHTYWTAGLNVSNCLEQSLESYEVCNLVETFPAKHESFEDYKKTLKYAYLYAKTVTLGKTHWTETNRVMLRNRRIGTSMSGIVQSIEKHGMETFRQWADKGYKAIKEYDEIYSDWLAIPRSIKVTSVKPSGTVSLLAGATPGVHFPDYKRYIRRMRISINSDLVPMLEQAGYPIEPAIGSEESTLVVEIPVELNDNIRTTSEVSMWEQLALAAFMQRWWADNQVSCTVKFNPEIEGNQIKSALDHYQYQLKGISFLPEIKGGAYPQMPYEAISEEEYTKRNSEISYLDFSNIVGEEAEVDKFCTDDHCIVEIEEEKVKESLKKEKK